MLKSLQIPKLKSLSSFLRFYVEYSTYYNADDAYIALKFGNLCNALMLLIRVLAYSITFHYYDTAKRIIGKIKVSL